MARLFEEGAMPVAGGVLDQAHSGMQAIQHARLVNARFKANYLQGAKK
jgi:hypothetical protein